MTVRPVNDPLAWVGADRILLDDTSRYGLRRKVIARRGEPMDVETWLGACERQAGQDVTVYGWLVMRDEYWLLWLVWKVGRSEQ